jgi:hypothetical protein
MAARFYNPWADHHIEMVEAIEHAAKNGGDQAIAAPRGDGKTEICTAMIVRAILACYVRFPVIVAATGDFALRIFKDVKLHFENNDTLAEDFPEVCTYIRDLEGAPSRANKQHNGGVRTRIVWTQHEVVFPTVAGSPYGGVTIAFKGLDSAIRGIRSRGKRPDFVLIDDPETKESAKSDTQIEDRTLSIERDIAGLSGPDKQLSRVMLTTIQNRRCLSYQFTDPKQKPSWRGKRFKSLVKPPDNLEMWEEYIALRQQDQQSDDKESDRATEHYLANRDLMDAGAVMSNEHRIKPGSISALQTYYNAVADNGIGYAKSELDNDPEDDAPIESMKLTPGTIQVRMSGLAKSELPRADSQITVGIDVGKYYSHWVKLAIHGNATGHVIDYGVMESDASLDGNSTEEAIERALVRSLETWRSDIMSVNQPQFCLIDSGDYSSAIYSFVRQYGSPFAASKGHGAGRLHMNGTDTKERLHFEQCRADYQTHEKIWLYNFDSEYWKTQVQQRFLTKTFNEANILNDGSLSVWSTENKREHLAYAHHICAEERQETFIQGKGLVRKWVVKNKNNHWLDATALALCAAGCLGMRIVPRIQAQAPVIHQVNQKPNRFIQRPGGWIKGMGR